MHVEAVEVRRPRPACTPIFETALKLAEKSQVGTKMKIRRQQVALEKVASVILRSGAETGLIEQFEFLPKFTTKRDERTYISIIPAATA